jgi:hypothetical protein
MGDAAWADISDESKDLVDRMLNKDPQQRVHQHQGDSGTPLVIWCGSRYRLWSRAQEWHQESGLETKD